MKKLLAILLAWALLLGMAGCRMKDADQPTAAGRVPAQTDGTPAQPPAEPQPPEVRVAYKAQYVRTDGYISGAQYPQVHIIQSVQELDNYSDEWYHNWLNAFFPENPETARTDITAGLMEACESYD